MKLANVFAWAKKMAPDVGRNAIGLCGLGLISYGAALIYHPLGYIVPGILLVALAALMPKAKRL
jgi:hypothetical protein